MVEFPRRSGTLLQALQKNPRGGTASKRWVFLGSFYPLKIAPPSLGAWVITILAAGAGSKVFLFHFDTTACRLWGAPAQEVNPGTISV